MISEQDIVNRLSEAASHQIDNPYPAGVLNDPLQPAAVLLPLIQHEDDWHILLIRRAHNDADYHSAQMALPGGRVQIGDNSRVSTALREAHEEIGVQPADVKILGQMNEFATISDHIITPVVGIMPWPNSLTLQTEEVSETLIVPLSWIASSDNYEIRKRTLSHKSYDVPILYFREYQHRVIWGVTARILVAFTKLLA